MSHAGRGGTGGRVPEVLGSGFRFLEGPRWRDGRLWVSDQHAHTVYSLDDRGGVRVEAELDDMPSGLGFLPDETLLIASMRDRTVLRRDGGTLRVHADLSGWGAGWVNDMVVDGRGRAFVGLTFGRLYERASETDLLVRIDPDGSHQVVSDSVSMPNGAAVSEDGRFLVLAESGAGRISVFVIGEDGALGPASVFAVVPGPAPDGLCLDAEGAAWVAFPRAGAFRRIADGGEVLDEIPVEGRSIACVLGGPERRTLHLLVDTGPGEGFARLREAPDGSRDAELSDCVSSVLTVEVDVPGAGLP